MATNGTSMRWWLAFFAVGFTLGCVVSLDPDKDLFTCQSDADCGGDGYTCVTPATAAARCCKPSGDEQCGNAVDDDCDGQIDEGVSETCNSADDDCDGQVDETFNLQTDALNCGACGNACDAATQRCEQGSCKVRGEINCSNGLDDDSDTLIDCADSDCANFSCGVGCTCRNGGKIENDCTNTLDDDLDGNPDCADSDCNAAACGAGCQCFGGLKIETNCNDGVDNNGDAGADCADPGCFGQLCQASPSVFRCDLAGACGCRDAGANPPAEGGAACSNGIDDNCNGQIDCQDSSCNGASCSSDGGCQCRNGAKAETACTDTRDNDGDGLTDCADMLADGGGDCGGVQCNTTPNRFCSWDTSQNAGRCR